MPNDKEFELDDLESFSFDDLSLDDPSPEPGAAGDPDPQGVWVKKGPEDVPGSEDTLAEPSFDLPDLDPLDTLVPSTEPEGLADEDYLSSEELANLDESFDFVTVDEPLEGESPLEEDLGAEPGAIPAFDEVSLDDFVGLDAPAEDALAPLDEPEEATDEAPGEDFLDIDIDIEDDIKDDELEILEGGVPTFDDELDVPDTFSAESVDLSEFADFEELAPVSPPSDEDLLPEVSEVPDLATSLEGDEGFFEEKVLDDPIPSLDLEPADHTDLDHILALEETLTSGVREPEPAATEPAPQPANQDLAALILGKLEQELSSIKKEISDLKREVTSLRTPDALGAPPEPQAESDESSPKSHGFFDEEDDETIALTGDELDNLLSTAEVSEGEESGVALDEDLLSLDAEGNLVEPAEDSEVHVTDEEFLAGTSLDLNETDFGDAELGETEVDQDSLGVPESIELEEVDLPESLDAGETEDLLAPLPSAEEFFDDATSLEIPSDLELSDLGSATNDLVEQPLGDEFDALEESPEAPVVEESVVEEAIPEPLLEDIEAPAPLPPVEAPAPAAPGSGLSPALKDELRAVLSYMDKLLASLPDEKIQEFAESEHFEVYKKLFEELGLVE